MASFFELDLERHLSSEGHLSKIDRLLKLYRFSKILTRIDSDLGPGGYDLLQMFKCLTKLA